jgi:hypothetical protein
MYKNRFFMMSLMVITMLLMNAINPSVVYADDGTPTDPLAEEIVEIETPEEGATPETPDDDVIDGEMDMPVVEATEEPVGEPTGESVEESAEAPINEEYASEESSDETIYVPDLLAQVPEDTELVVLNVEGEAEPLATEEATEILETGDPIWCPAGQAPTSGANGCTDSYATFEELIAALEADASSGTPVYVGSGTIYVEATYIGNDGAQIVFDGSVLTNLSNGGSTLTMQGGWNGDEGTDFDINTDIVGTSLADVSVVFVNWTGNIVINDFDIQNTSDGAGFGLFIDTDGAITLDNVSVNNTTANTSGFGEGAELYSTGDINITDSEFDENQGNGLQATSGGNITLTNVSAVYNTLTGAYLDSCLYGFSTPGLCDGAGNISVTTSVFNNNGFNGLVTNAGGNTTLDTVQASNNGLNGAYVTGTDANGTGDVLIQNSNFLSNSNGTGLDVYSDGSITLTNVAAQMNNFGAVLDTTSGNGNVSVNTAQFSSNDWTGLHVESGDDVALVNVTASNNGANGAYLVADGDIVVTTSQFDDNVHFPSPQDPGLYVEANGNILLTNVNANGNDFGAGAVLVSNGAGEINVVGGTFNTNGTFGLQAQSGIGNINISAIEASYNGVKGLYVLANGLGNIFINNGIFVENDDYGIYAKANEGNIDLFGVTVTGNDVTDIGAFLETLNGGNIFVDTSTFEYNTNTGLVVVASGPVNLVDVTADHNGGNGVEVYSTYTDGCRCSGDEVVNIVVNVDGGSYANNGFYGLMVKPGPEGDLVFINPAIFGGNGLGDYLLDLSEPTDCDPCDCGDCCDPEGPKEPKIVQVPFEGGDPVEQDCETTSGTILQLPNGTWVKVGCPFDGYSTLGGITEEQLPGSMGAGTNFVSGITIGLTDDEGNFVLNSDGTITMSFKIPEDSRGRGYSILFWDLTLNDGEGGWVQLPLFEFGTSFFLNPDDPEDGRMIISGVQEVNGFVTVTVNFPGIFVLVER